MPDPFVLPDGFVEELHASWGRAPRVWRAPFARPYATAATAFDCLRTLRQRLELADARMAPRLYVDGAQRGLLYEPHLPTAEDGDLEGYQRRLLGLFGAQRVGLVVPDPQCLDERVWWNALRIARPLFERVGFPAGGSHAEIFFGNYRQSFFQLHKDHLDTLTFVASGRKRLLVWPYHVFADEPGAPPDGELKQVHFEAPVDWESRREQANVLEGGTGDVFYWPASYWHVAEAVDDGFVTTFTLAFFATATRASGSPFRLAHDAFARAALDGLDTSDPPLPAVQVPGQDAAARAAGVGEALAGMQRQLERHLADRDIARVRKEFYLGWLSALGFQHRPLERAPTELAPDAVIETRAENPLLWAEVSGDGFPCAVNGIILTALPKFLPLVEHLNGGGRFRVAELVARFVTGEGEDPLSEEELFAALAQLGAARYFEVVESEMVAG